MGDNIDKSHHGKSGQENLKDIIELMLDKNYIVSYKSDYRDGYRGYDDKQFFFQYYIEFVNQEGWILHSTTSIRSDRMNIQQWNAEHLKRLNGYIKKAFVVYPNGLSDKENQCATSYQKKLLEQKAYSAVDGVVSQSEMYSRVEKYALSLMDSKGKALATRGNNFESWIVEIINNTENFLKWKNNDAVRTGFFYDVFIQLIDNMGLNRHDVVGISATNTVPKLPSGGKAKTDVIIVADTADSAEVFTYSCKKSGSDWVSVHEYTADQFTFTLKIDDEELAKAINEFQLVGSIERMSQNALEAMNNRMGAYTTALNEWVIGGRGGQGNPNLQWANNIITYNDNTSQIAIYTLDEYIDKMKAQGAVGNFGTIFRWTYPSGGQGKRIQLKMKLE